MMLDTIKKYDKRFKQAGLKVKTKRFVLTYYLTLILLFIFILVNFKLGYILGPILTILYYYLIQILINREIKLRIKKLEYEALNFFEIFALSLESGKNLETALEVTVFNVDSDLSNEFKQTLFEIKFGKSLKEALISTSERIPSEVINNIILNIIEADKYGNDIISIMYNQVEFLRKKNLLEVKGEINKIPNKISIVSVIFMIPLILIIILGPIIINFIS